MQTEDVVKIIASFLDHAGCLAQFPAKRKKKNYALFYLASKFEKEKRYTESEVNALLDKWHTFRDAATLRRELYNAGFLDRETDGTSYRLAQNPPTVEELEKRFG